MNTTSLKNIKRFKRPETLLSAITVEQFIWKKGNLQHTTTARQDKLHESVQKLHFFVLFTSAVLEALIPIFFSGGPLKKKKIVPSAKNTGTNIREPGLARWWLHSRSTNASSTPDSTSYLGYVFTSLLWSKSFFCVFRVFRFSGSFTSFWALFNGLGSLSPLILSW